MSVSLTSLASSRAIWPFLVPHARALFLAILVFVCVGPALLREYAGIHCLLTACSLLSLLIELRLVLLVLLLCFYCCSRYYGYCCCCYCCAGEAVREAEQEEGIAAANAQGEADRERQKAETMARRERIGAWDSPFEVSDHILTEFHFFQCHSADRP